MNKVRTAMIDGVGIRTSLSAIEIASLPKINAELVKKNEKLEHNWNELKKDIEDKIEIIEEQYIKNRMKFSELFIIEMRSRKRGYERILNRMQELERGEE